MKLENMEVNKSYYVGICSKDPDNDDSWLESVRCEYIAEEEGFWVGKWAGKTWKMKPDQAVSEVTDSKSNKPVTKTLPKKEKRKRERKKWWKNLKIVWE